MPRLAQHPLDHRCRILPATVREAERPNRTAGQRLEPSRLLDELRLGRCLVDYRPAEEMTASVVRDLTSIRRQPGEVLRVEEDPAIGSEACLIDLEALPQLLTHLQAPVVGHGGDDVEELQEGDGSACSRVKRPPHLVDADGPTEVREKVVEREGVGIEALHP